MRIDAHQHFWRYSPGEYAWIDERMGTLARDYLPSDLGGELASAGFEGCVAVQARQSLEETAFLLHLARETDFVLGVVGWADLRSPSLGAVLDDWSGESFLVGLRHVVQDEPDPEFLLRADFLRGIEALRERGLVYDVLVYPHHLPVTARFVERFPEQPFVLDHMAKPPVAADELEPWRTHLVALAEHPHVHCKLSGLVTEARWNDWTPDQLHPYLDAAYEAFGEDRVMYGSDWPVCLLSARGYADQARVVLDWAEQLSPAAREKLLGANAARFYGLET